MQQLGKSPLVRVNAAAPLYGFQAIAVSCFCDLGRFAFGAMIAPQIIFAERLKVFADGNHG